jgi:hypothetical protein
MQGQEDGFGKLHFLIAAVFAVTVALGSFATVQALTSMSDDAMSDVTGQEGIIMDLEIGGSFQFDALWKDDDGSAGNSGVVGLHGITPSGSNLNILGITVDADAGVALESTATTGGTRGAIVIGIPSIPSGITVTDVDPGQATMGSFPGSSSNSIGSVAVGGITNVSGAEIQIGAN